MIRNKEHPAKSRRIWLAVLLGALVFGTHGVGCSTSAGAAGRALAVESGWDGVAAPDAINWEAVTPGGQRVTTAAGPAAKTGKKGQAPSADKTGKLRTAPRLLTGSFRYAGFHAAATVDGAKANVDVPTIGTPDAGDHSLVEIDVEREAGAGVIDAVELGFNVDAALYGNTNPHLFGGTWEAFNFMGYNGGNGYTDIVDTCGTAGANVVLGQTETAGVAVNLQILYGGTPTGWYLYRNNCAFGYWPASAWTGTTLTSATTTYTQGFGEIWDADGSVTPCTNMGNGTLASNTPAGAAVGSWLYGTAPSSAVNMIGFTSNVISTSYYNEVNVSGSKRTMRYGGPGQC